MGLYDRDYYRSDESGYHVSIGSWTLTTKIVLVNVGVYLLQVLTKEQGPALGWFSDTFALHADWWTRPWMFFQLLTYGFLHSTANFFHIVFNMLMLWFLGRDLEAKYGRREFLTFYLTAIVVAGLAWSGVQYFLRDVPAVSLGASGGAVAVLVLFAFNFPRRELLLWFVIPVPVWVVALLFVIMDIFGAVGTRAHNIGYEAHLGGAAFALGYYQLGWRLSRWFPSGVTWPSVRRRPKLRVHRPDAPDESLETQVDDVLRKIQEQGLDSLTRKERQILERAGEEYKRRRQ